MLAQDIGNILRVVLIIPQLLLNLFLQILSILHLLFRAPLLETEQHQGVLLLDVLKAGALVLGLPFVKRRLQREQRRIEVLAFVTPFLGALGPRKRIALARNALLDCLQFDAIYLIDWQLLHLALFLPNVILYFAELLLVVPIVHVYLLSQLFDRLLGLLSESYHLILLNEWQNRVLKGQFSANDPRLIIS